MARYRITLLAEARLEEIWLYSALNWGADQADQYHEKLEGAFQRLADGRAAGKACTKFYEDAPEEIKYYLEGRHYVIFRVAGEGEIEILTVIHGSSAQQLEEFLREA